ncbi:MAG: DUF4838 domain-containing protein [Clostridia bacterium]|nr:DUF4838 domain-containing protein [Clostridia bacterium]
MKSEILIHPEELTEKQIDRMASRGVNVLGLHPVGGDSAVDSLNRLLAQIEQPSFRILLDYAAECGLEIEYEMHAASYLLPRELFETHPEYFRMNEDGERVADYNFCVSNSEGLEIVAARAAELAHRLYRSRPAYYFWMDDIREKPCHCPACRKLSVAEQQLTALNRMIREIRKTIPNAKMAHIAYLDCIDVPHAVKPEEGIFLEFAPIEKYKDRPDRTREEEERRMMPLLLDYFGKEDAKVLEYWLDNSLFSHWKKPPKPFSADPEKVKAEVLDYADAGFSLIATFGCYLGEDYEALYGEPNITPFTDAFL